jgi:hypothetical protein
MLSNIKFITAKVAIEIFIRLSVIQKFHLSLHRKII